MSTVQGVGGMRGGCVSVWYRLVLCTTYSAVGTGGCDVHGTGVRREERWLCLCVVQVGIFIVGHTSASSAKS